MSYWERNTSKMFCPICLKCKKSTTNCCDQNMVPISYKARAPKITANKKEWRTFYEKFLHGSHSERVIDNMRKLKMDVSGNLAIQQKNVVTAAERNDYLPAVIRLEIEDYKESAVRISQYLTDLSEFYISLTPNHRKQGKEYLIVSNRKYFYRNEIFASYSKDYEIREVKASYGEIGHGRTLGFYQNIAEGKVFRPFTDFAVFDNKEAAELYQWILHNDTSIYPYKDKMDKLMRKNKIREERPEYFL